jgi:hypothetical protein
MDTVPAGHRLSRLLVASVLLAVTALAIWAAVRSALPERAYDLGRTIVAGVHDSLTSMPESEDQP